MRASVLIWHNVRCSRVVVLLATSVLRCNIQRKYSVCQSIIHLDDFFLLSIYSILCLSTQPDCSMPLNPSSNNWTRSSRCQKNTLLILDLTWNRLPISVCLVKMRRDKGKENTAKGKRLGCFALYSFLPSHTNIDLSTICFTSASKERFSVWPFVRMKNYRGRKE